MTIPEPENIDDWEVQTSNLSVNGSSPKSSSSSYLVSETGASLLEWRERWIIRGEKAHEPEFESYFAQRQVYLDRYRRAFLESSYGQCLLTFPKGEMKGQCSNFLLLGVHGIGKSQFLLDLGRILVHCGGPSYFFIYISMASGNIPCSIVELIFGALKDFKGIKIPDNVKDVVELHAWLRKKGFYIVIVLDEFQHVYKKEDIGTLISNLAHIGNFSKKRHLIVFLSGSHALLHPLVYFNSYYLPANVRIMYPGLKKFY